MNVFPSANGRELAPGFLQANVCKKYTHHIYTRGADVFLLLTKEVKIAVSNFGFSFENEFLLNHMRCKTTFYAFVYL